MSLSVLTADTTNNPHKKPPPYFFCAALQLLITPPHRATANQVRDPFFFACEGESHLSPAPTPHAGGASSGQTVPGPFHLGTPPCPLGVSCPGGPKSCPPVSTRCLARVRHPLYTPCHYSCFAPAGQPPRPPVSATADEKSGFATVRQHLGLTITT